MNEHEKKVDQMTRILKIILDLNRLITHEKDASRLIETACKILVSEQIYHNAWIVLFPRSDSGYLFVQDGIGKEFDEMDNYIRSGRLTQCAEKALQSGQMVIYNDPTSECPDCLLSLHYEGRKAIAAPIKYNQEIYGIIVVSIPKVSRGSEEETDFFPEIAESIGYALWSLETERVQTSTLDMLKDNEEKFYTFFSHATDMIYLLEILPDQTAGRILEVNDQACKKMGYTREELLKMNLSDLKDPEFKGDFRQVLDHLKKSDDMLFEWMHVTKMGGKIPVEISGLEFKIKGENVALAIVREISERKELENELLLTRFSVDKSPISIFWMKPDGSFFYVNKAACSELGYTKDELLGLRVNDVDPGYPIERRKEFWNELKEKGTIRIETTHKKKDGAVFLVEVTTYYLKYGKNEFEIANSMDITERKLAERKILENEKKYRELFNNVTEAVFLHKIIKGNRRGNFVEVNDTACRRLGYTREELLKLSVSDINTPEIRKDDIKRVEQIKKKGSVDFEGVHVRKDGSKFPVFVKARMIEIGGEQYILSLVRDITIEKENRKDQIRVLKKIENNLMQMSTLNDRIRNPLCVIAGITDLEGGKNAEKILKQVNEIDELIKQLDQGWLESLKIRDYLKRHYEVELEEMPEDTDEK
ncbi:MAG: PAS domain S-box protein [Methanomicrobiaceae archaeon]|nr:PAS domain S-box protein [Methanomicrobiaceae archaeon]